MRSSSLAAAALVVLAVCSLPFARALFEEQAGSIDWYREQLGAATHVLYPDAVGQTQPSASSSVPASRLRASVLIGTRNGALALLKSKTGAVVWRQVLPDGDAIEQLLLDRGTVITVSGAGRLVRAWAVADGALLWDSASSQTLAPNGVAAAAAAGDAAPAGPAPQWREFDAVFCGQSKSEGGRTAMLYRNAIRVVTTETGQEVWKAQLRAGWTGRRLVCSDNKLYLIASSAGDAVGDATIQVTAFNAKGEVESEKSAGSLTAAHSFVVAEGYAVLVGPSSARVIRVSDASAQTTDLTSVVSSEQARDLSTGEQARVSAPFGAWGKKGGAFVLATKTAQAVLKVTDTLGLKALHTFPVKSTESLSLTGALGASNDAIVVRTFTRGSAVSIEAVSDAGAATTIVKSVVYERRGNAVATFAGAIPSGNKADARSWFVTVVGGDDSMSGMSQESGSAVLWTREEALAAVRAVTFVELPLAHAFDQHSFPSLSNRLVPQLKQLVKTARDWAIIAQSLITTQRFPQLLDADESVDQFGFAKLAGAATDAGKLFALHTEDGRVVWATPLPEALGGAAYRVWKLLNVAPHTVVVVSRAVDGGRSAVLHTVNTLKGTVLATTVLEFGVSDVLVLPASLPVSGAADGQDDSHQVLALIDAEQRVHLHPSTAAAVKLFGGSTGDLGALRHKLHFHVVDTAASAVRGYAVAKASAADPTVFDTINTWTVAFQPDVETITTFAGRSEGEAIHSAIRMITSADSGMQMLYKYINPHLLAVGTVRSTPSSSSPRPVLKKSTDPSVNIYLIDTVSGAVVEKFVHRHCAGPIRIVQAENVVFYHYWNSAAHQYEVSVVELFQERDTSRAEDVEFSSFAAPAPQVTQQTYALRTGAKALAVTRTAMGITQKDLLVGMTSDQLLSVSKHFLDPRRPTEEPTQAEREEGLVPYHPDLPADPLFVVSYNRTIHHLRAIVTSTARLESTSLVLAYGLDLFYTRVTPSQTFDLLNEDFNYGFLIVTLLIVAVPIVILRRMAKKADLQRAWK